MWSIHVPNSISVRLLEFVTLNRPPTFNYIEEKLNFLAFRIELRGKLNLLDLHLHSEDFYLHFCNELFGWQLRNMNAIDPNAEAIDLIDDANNLVAQVSATAKKVKIESALSKDLSSYSRYRFMFISISKDATSLRDETYTNPHCLIFNPKTDILDVPSLLREIKSFRVEDQSRIAAFLRKELAADVDPIKLESNLANIINILAREDLAAVYAQPETIPFEIISKIEFNELRDRRDFIADFNVYCGIIDRIYSDFDREGSNKSWSVLNAIRTFYQKHAQQLHGHRLFDKVIECVTERVHESLNYVHIPIDELEPCVHILVVDAFIRCKIFKNPTGHLNAST